MKMIKCKCFQFAATVAFNDEEIKKDLQRIEIKPFINKYNGNGIKYPSKLDDWKALEKNNSTIAFNILYIKEKQIYPAYILKHNPWKTLWWHYLEVKKLSALLLRITSKTNGDFYCLNCLHSFRIENKHKSHEKVCKNKDFCGIVMPSEKDNILGFKIKW